MIGPLRFFAVRVLLNGTTKDPCGIGDCEQNCIPDPDRQLASLVPSRGGRHGPPGRAGCSAVTRSRHGNGGAGYGPSDSSPDWSCFGNDRRLEDGATVGGRPDQRRRHSTERPERHSGRVPDHGRLGRVGPSLDHPDRLSAGRARRDGGRAAGPGGAQRAGGQARRAGGHRHGGRGAKADAWQRDRAGRRGEHPRAGGAAGQDPGPSLGERAGRPGDPLERGDRDGRRDADPRRRLLEPQQRAADLRGRRAGEQPAGDPKLRVQRLRQPLAGQRSQPRGDRVDRGLEGPVGGDDLRHRGVERGDPDHHQAGPGGPPHLRRAPRGGGQLDLESRGPISRRTTTFRGTGRSRSSTSSSSTSRRASPRRSGPALRWPSGRR